MRFRPPRAAALLLFAIFLVGAGRFRQPEVGRLDPMLALAAAELERHATLELVTEIPRPARSAGVYAGPGGPSDPWVRVILRGPGSESAVRMAGGAVGTRLGPVVTARIPLRQAQEVAESPGVAYVEASAPMRPHLDTSIPEINVDLLHGAGYNLRGSGVLVAIFDSGIDFTHDDFRNPDGTSRIVAIWDQTAVGPGPTSIPGFSSTVGGLEWTRSEIDAELSSPTGTISQQDITGHGTHVAGIAAGDGSATGGGQPAGRYLGVAPEADILIIKGGDDTFSSTGVLEGVAYAFAKAGQLGVPAVVNLSLGGHLGPHDGQSNYEQGLDAGVGTGRVVVVSAGNEGDSGIHGRATVSSATTADIRITVPTYAPESGTENDYVDMNIWYESSAQVRLGVQAPGGTSYGPFPFGFGAPSGQSEDKAEGAVLVASGSGGGGLDNVIILKIRDETAAQEPAEGTWTLTFELTSGSGATIDLWIFDTSLGGSAEAEVAGAAPDYTVAIPGTADKAITVGSYVTKWSWTSIAGAVQYAGPTNRTSDYSTFSSRGPSRDGRTKPEITAPGQGIMSALSTLMPYPGDSWTDPDGVHRLSQGTSQAAPHVTGVVALMLQADDTLTAAQIKGYLIAAARTDAFTGTVPSNVWGHGKLDGKGAVDRVQGGSDTTPPQVTIGILRNSVLTDYLDIYLFPDEALLNPPTMDVSGEGVPVEAITTSEGTLYVGDYRLTAGGTHTITVVAEDLFGNQATVTRDFTAALVSIARGGRLLSADGVVRAVIGAGTVERDGYLLLTRIDSGTFPVESGSGTGVLLKPLADGGGISMPYALIPASETLHRKIRLEFSYDPADLRGAEPTTLGIFHREEGGWRNVESYVNVRRRRVEASIDRLGIYRLQAGVGPGTLRTALHPNYPNPFNGGTQIRFTLAKPSEVELFVLNVRGQRVRTLVSGMQPAGSRVIGWDGRGPSGRRLASGIYLLVLRTGDRTFTRKVLLLR